jgi:hypothetical protein
VRSLGDAAQPNAADAQRLAAPIGQDARARPAMPEPARFDPRQAELRLVDQHWQLQAGKVMLKDFGAAEAAAHEAVELIRDLRLTQHGSIGAPVPVMEYWLSDGHAPQGPLNKYATLHFDRASLHVAQVQGQWYLRDANQMLVNFGSHSQDAQAALEVLRRYEFNQVAFIGFPTPLMMVFLASEVRRSSQPAPASATLGPAANSPAYQAARLQTCQLAPPSSDLADGIAGERFPFDWRQVELRRERYEWKLMVGSYCLANFGCHEWDAREALRVIHHYRFTEHCRVGAQGPPFSYFLVDGTAPRGVLFGLHTVQFRPDTLTVRGSNGAWAIYDSNRTILQFGDRADEARRALQLIQHYQFDHLCQVGNLPTPAMTFLVRER